MNKIKTRIKKIFLIRMIKKFKKKYEGHYISINNIEDFKNFSIILGHKFNRVAYKYHAYNIREGKHKTVLSVSKNSATNSINKDITKLKVISSKKFKEFFKL